MYGGGGGKTLVLTLAALLAAALVAVWAAEVAPAEAQSDDETAGRIVARLLNDGRVEFGWQLADGARILPTQRRFSADITHNRWLRSGPVEVDGAEIGRINARLSEDGRIEFAFTPTDGEQILPPARYFPHSATHEQWLRSTEISFFLRAQRKNLLTERLFGLRPGEADAVTSHDLNDWGCNVVASPPADCNAGRAFYEALVNKAAWNAYEGGHGGWDASHRNRRPVFYSLSEGEVIAAGGNGWPCNDIAVYDEDARKTTIYLHAGTVLVGVGDPVSVGTPLGTEGTRCRGTVSEHVHVEVREGRSTALRGGGGRRIYARGAGIDRPDLSAGEVSINPLSYLFAQVCEEAGTSLVVPGGAAICSGMLIRDRNSPEVYVFKTKDGKRFRRHVVTDALYDEVPDWSGDVVQSVSAATFGMIRKSPLVRIPGDADSVYVVEEMGEDDIVLRHIPGEAVFNSAGCDWDGVFAMSRDEYDYWVNKLGPALSGSPVDSGFKCPS